MSHHLENRTKSCCCIKWSPGLEIKQYNFKSSANKKFLCINNYFQLNEWQEIMGLIIIPKIIKTFHSGTYVKLRLQNLTTKCEFQVKSKVTITHIKPTLYSLNKGVIFILNVFIKWTSTIVYIYFKFVQ